MAKTYVSQTQLDHLLTFMENNPSVAKNYSPKSTQGRYELSSLWKKLADELNSMGFPNKSAKDWRRYCTEYKYRSKKKYSQNILSKNKTGGGPAEEVDLDEMEERVVSLARIKNAVCGNGGSSFGASNKIPYAVKIDRSTIEKECATKKGRDATEDEFEHVEYLEEDPLTYVSAELNDNNKNSTSSQEEGPPKRRNYSSTQITSSLLQQQLNNDEKFQTEVLTILKERNNQELVLQTKINELTTMMDEKNKQDLNFQTNLIQLLKERNLIEKQKLQMDSWD